MFVVFLVNLKSAIFSIFGSKNLLLFCVYFSYNHGVNLVKWLIKGDQCNYVKVRRARNDVSELYIF